MPLLRKLVVPQLFRTVIADPPWNERGGGKIKRGADRRYDLLTVDAIIAIMAEQLKLVHVSANAHLYCWVTNTYLANGEGLRVVRELGFVPKTIVTWYKDRIGIGQYFRGKTEHMIFAIRGRGMDPGVYTERRDLPGAFDAPHELDPSGRIIHSRKPERSYQLIEERSRGPYLELFATKTRPGWTGWAPKRHIDNEGRELT